MSVVVRSLSLPGAVRFPVQDVIFEKLVEVVEKNETSRF